MPILKLLISDLLHRKMRCFLTVGAVAIAVSLVVAMTSGFDTLQRLVYGTLGTLYGDVDVEIKPEEEFGLPFNDAFVQAVRSDSRVREMRPQFSHRTLMADDNGRAIARWPLNLVGIEPEEFDAEQRNPLRSGEWFAPGDGYVAVVDEALLGRQKKGLGDSIRIIVGDESRELKVVGTTIRMGIMQIEAPSVFVPISTMQEMLNQPGAVNLLQISLNAHVDVSQYVQEVKQLSVPGNPTLSVQSVETQKANFDRMTEGLKLFTYVAGSISLLSAVFIIFSTLTMGVMERSRLMAMLRAIGAERRQVARLVLVEGLVLGLVGAVAGVSLGRLWLELMSRRTDFNEIGQIMMSPMGVLYAVSCALGAALLASLLPAYMASRVDALEAMAVAAKPRNPKVPWLLALVGLLLLTVDPLTTYAGDFARESRILVHVFIGLPCVLMGLVAISPALVIIVDRVFGPIVARLLWLRPDLLRQQLSGGLWRSADTAVALMVGLVVLVLLRVHGNNLISAWKLPDRFPDLLIFSPLGYTADQVAALDQIEGMSPGRVLPTAIVSPTVGANIFSVGGIVQTPDSTIMFGVDVEKTFLPSPEGQPEMVELQWIQGTQAEAAIQMMEVRKIVEAEGFDRLPQAERAELLKGHRRIIVSEEFHALQGLGVGDKIELDTPIMGKVEYEIVGVVRSPGVDFLVRLLRMNKEFEKWTAASVLTDLSLVKQDFGVQRFQLMAATMKPDLPDRGKAQEAAKRQLMARGLFSAGSAELKNGIEFGLRRVIDLISSVAFMALMVASVGVTNTIMASIRSRQWQFGVLRSMGLTRMGLLRIVVAEAIMIAIVATMLGLGGGVMMSLDAIGMWQYMTGVRVEYTLTREPLILGGSVTLAVAIAACALPALRVAFTSPLRLLQGGRTTA